MTSWSHIACQRGHGTHATKTVRIALPEVAFDMVIFDHTRYQRAGGYCPAFDLVSRTIDETGAWEAVESALVAQVCVSAVSGQVMVDLGCQIGWFSCIAASVGCQVLAVDADTECLRLLDESSELNGYTIHTVHRRIGPETDDLHIGRPIRLAKIDVEGAEADALRILAPSIDAGQVDHILLEVSPVFGDGYPDLVADLMDRGYDAALVGATALRSLDRATVEREIASVRQANVWCKRQDASW